LLTGTTGEVGFTGPTTGLGFTGPRTEIGFAGPPSAVCFTGAASGVCFLTPPIELWAEAGREKSPPKAAATMMIAIVLFFMDPSPGVSAQTIGWLRTQGTRIIAPKLKPRQTESDLTGIGGMTPPPSSVIGQANHPRAGRAS
jgi:hypothetical protein